MAPDTRTAAIITPKTPSSGGAGATLLITGAAAGSVKTKAASRPAPDQMTMPPAKPTSSATRIGGA